MAAPAADDPLIDLDVARRVGEVSASFVVELLTLISSISATRTSWRASTRSAHRLPYVLFPALPGRLIARQAKNAEVETQLNMLLSSRLEAGRESLDLLQHSASLVSGIRSTYALLPDNAHSRSFDSIEKLCSESTSLAAEYPLIKQVNTVRTNLLSTKQELSRMLDIPGRVPLGAILVMCSPRYSSLRCRRRWRMRTTSSRCTRTSPNSCACAN